MTVLDDATRQSWQRFFAQDGRFDVHYDAERFRTIARRNLRDAIVLIVFVVVVLALVLLWGRVGPIVLGILLFVVGGILAIVLLRRRLSLIRPAGGAPGLLLGVSNAGLHTPLVPVIEWAGVRAVFAVDESARPGRASRHLWFLLEDAPALRAQVADRRWAKGFETFTNVNGPAFAQYILDLDTVLSLDDAKKITSAVLVQAQARGIHAVESLGASDFAEYASMLSGVTVDGVVPPKPADVPGNPFRH